MKRKPIVIGLASVAMLAACESALKIQAAKNRWPEQLPEKAAALTSNRPHYVQAAKSQR